VNIETMWWPSGASVRSKTLGMQMSANGHLGVEAGAAVGDREHHALLPRLQAQPQLTLLAGHGLERLAGIAQQVADRHLQLVAVAGDGTGALQPLAAEPDAAVL